MRLALASLTAVEGQERNGNPGGDMARVITAQRADECRATECKAASREIAAGARINYGGYNAVTHEGCTAIDAPRSSRTRGGRSYAARSGHYGRTSWGRGRCEDAPCCGCCG